MEKKNLVPNSTHTRPGQENSKKNSKKIRKPLPGIIISQNGDEIRREIEEKNFSPEFRSYSTRERKIRKK